MGSKGEAAGSAVGEAVSLGALDLHDAPLMDDDLDDAESEGGHVLAEDIDPIAAVVLGQGPRGLGALGSQGCGIGGAVLCRCRAHLEYMSRDSDLKRQLIK